MYVENQIKLIKTNYKLQHFFTLLYLLLFFVVYLHKETTMKTRLNYYHGRSLFRDSQFKPFVNKYFKDVRFLGFESGYWGPSISISNWDENKDPVIKKP